MQTFKERIAQIIVAQDVMSNTKDKHAFNQDDLCVTVYCFYKKQIFY